MSDDSSKAQDQLNRIQSELNSTGLSRRSFLNRLRAAGVGFGAAFAFGARDGEAHGAIDGNVKLGSSNPAVDDILGKNSPMNEPEQDPKSRVAYVRVFRRTYRRYARGFRRVFARF